MLAENAAYLGRLGQQVSDVSQLLSFEFMQADGLSPISYLASGIDAWAESAGLPLNFGRTFPQTISQRYETGPLGRGWSHNWDFSLDETDDGTVTIAGPGGTRRVFEPDIRGGYFSQSGDHATLTDLGAGAFSVRERDGLLTVFRSDGKLDYAEDTNANRITAGYTGVQLTALTHTSGATLLFDYDAGGRIVSVTNPLGPGIEDDRVTTYSYDASGEHLQSIHRFDALVPTTYTYITGQGATTQHALSEIEYPGGTHEYFTYDTNGRLYEVFLYGQAEKVTFAYGSSGKVSATDAIGGTTDFFFDHRGLLVKREDPLDNPVHFTFDDQHNLLEITGPTGLSTSYDYDTQGNLIRSTDALGNSTSFAYDGPYDRLTDLTDANGNTTQFGYDTHGNQTSITYAGFTQEQFDYDAVGNPIKWTNRRDHAVDYAYDGLGRLTRKDYQDGSFVEYAYDNHGNFISAIDPTGTTTFDYEATTDRLERITYPGDRWLEFTYDTAGRRASSLDQLGHRLDYHYDPAGRLERITDTGGSEIVQYHYDDAGRLDRKELGNGVYTTYQYDAAGQLLRLDNRAPDTSELSRFDYTYDTLGRRTSMNTRYGLWTYEYDEIGQLTHAVLDSTDAQIPDQDLTYVYDALGNRIRTIVNGETTEYTTNNMNQYTQVGETTYVYDADGNLIREISPDGTTNYTYDDENRLIALSSSEGDWEYVHDAFGNRVAVTENGQTTHYVIDPIGLGNVVGEYDDAGQLVAHYDHGFDLLSRIDAVGIPLHYTFDAIGSTSDMTDVAGVVANSYAYGPFGLSVSRSETAPNPFEFVGAFGVMNESNGVESMRARSYDAWVGRFLSADPLMILSSFENSYEYAWNDPNSSIDPSGEIGQAIVVVMAIFGTIAVISCGSSLENFVQSANAASAAQAQHYGIDEEIYPLVGQYDASSEELQQQAQQDRNEGNVFGIAAGLPADVSSGHAFVGYFPTTKDMLESLRAGLRLGNRTTGDSFGSSDPNEKTGPGGYGELTYVAEDALLSYRVDVENEETATAPAQRVEVTDQLDANLDWSTFALTEIGFGDTVINVPDGSQHFETTVPMTNNDKDFEVQINVGINAATGEVRAVFQSIDPATGLPPDVLTGFLPPEDGTGRGMGHFNYIIDPKRNLSTGTEIRNVAVIQFDFGEIIATNQIDPHDPSQGTDPAKEALNTIDASIPDDASQVQPLPPTTTSTDFTVQWSGEDDPNGSGIGKYDIYVSIDDGPFEPWREGITETSDTYTGEIGHTYAIYSVATDNVGHREPMAQVADSVTFVGPNPWHNYLEKHDVNGQQGVTPLDVLLIIEYLNSHPGSTSLPAEQFSPPRYYAVNDGGDCTPLDVLMVIVDINSQGVGSPEQEGVQSAVPLFVPDRVVGEWASQPRSEQIPILGSSLASGTSTLPSPWSAFSGRQSLTYRFNRGDDRAVKASYDPQLPDELDTDLTYLDSILPDIVEDIDSVWRRS